MPKIAICLRGSIAKTHKNFLTQGSLYEPGEYVNYTACYNSIKKHIVEANPNYEFDFFIHCWNKDLEENLKNLYNPKKFLFEDNSIYNNEISIKVKILTDFSGISHSLSIKKVILLLEEYQSENNFEYDFIILYRPDIIIIKNIFMIDYNFNKIYSNGNASGDPKGDFHFLMNYNNLKKFKHMYDSIENGNPHKAHFWMENYVNNYIKQELISDNIIAGIDQEVLRKINIIMIQKNNIPIEKFYEYGLTKEEILKYNSP
jgi:hypothetical protein